jgi:hypothetical protein
MTATLLGCPHCRKPIGSVPRIAGQPVSCPYCRRPFQMPGLPEPPAKALPKVKVDVPEVEEAKTQPSLIVPDVSVPLDPFHTTNVLARRFVILGSVAILLAGTLVALEVVVPLFSSTVDRPANWPAGIVASLLVVACVAVSISGLLLLRALLRVGVETARAIRLPEPDATTAPKSE